MKQPNQTEPGKPKKLSFTENLQPPTPSPKWIPPELRGVTVYMGAPIEETIAKYGSHKMLIKRATFVCGQPVSPGDEVEVDAGSALNLLSSGRGEFIDPRKTEEAEILAKARELKIPLRDAENPAFRSQVGKRRRPLTPVTTAI